MIWAALSGVPCLRSCPLMANTLSLFLSFPSLAAKPPASKSRMKTPLSSDLRMSLMPSGSVRRLFISVTCRTVPGLWLEVGLPWGLWEGWEAVEVVDKERWWSERGSLDLKPFSCITVSLRTAGCRSTAMARAWGTEARLTSFTWKHDTTDGKNKRVNNEAVYRQQGRTYWKCALPWQVMRSIMLNRKASWNNYIFSLDGYVASQKVLLDLVVTCCTVSICDIWCIWLSVNFLVFSLSEP